MSVPDPLPFVRTTFPSLRERGRRLAELIYTLLPIVRGDWTGEPSSWEVSWPTEASFRLEQQDISRRV
ncbi:MAG TPA: hypothetical protein VEL76_11735, partial [Gemmataceae bacterium]|nr:hypothetical protein [Gemmataceae bacterium]